MKDKYLLTILVPGIRTGNWKKLYDSIYSSFSGSFEMIFISPYELPKELSSYTNIKLIHDWGTPIRCQQRGLVQAKGKYITWAADDGYFLPGALNISFIKLMDDGLDSKSLVMGKYYEGNNDGDFPMQDNKYYILSNHDGSKSSHLPSHYYMLNVGVVPKSLLFEIGGWDCKFEVCPMSYNDLAVRLQNYGCKFIIQDEMMYTCSHMPGTTGDHKPVHNAQIKHDQPLFKEIYSNIECTKRMTIPLNNWENAPSKWNRRFN